MPECATANPMYEIIKRLLLWNKTLKGVILEQIPMVCLKVGKLFINLVIGTLLCFILEHFSKTRNVILTGVWYDDSAIKIFAFIQHNQFGCYALLIFDLLRRECVARLVLPNWCFDVFIVFDQNLRGKCLASWLVSRGDRTARPSYAVLFSGLTGLVGVSTIRSAIKAKLWLATANWPAFSVVDGWVRWNFGCLVSQKDLLPSLANNMGRIVLQAWLNRFGRISFFDSCFFFTFGDICAWLASK